MIVALALTLQGCAAPRGQTPGQPPTAPTSNYDPCASNLARNIGAVAGGVLGAILAKQVKNTTQSKLIGAGIGAAIGAAIGKDVARRQCELLQVARKHNLELISTPLKTATNGASQGQGDALGMTAAIVDKGGSSGHFLPGSDELLPQAKVYFAEIASKYAPAARKAGLSPEQATAIDASRLLVVGHTDDQENSERAAELSERRAKAVAGVLRQAGVPEASIWYQGAGETMPIADNKSEEGRAKNRRVEISDFANQEVMTAYVESRTSTASYFRAVKPVALPVTTTAGSAAPAKVASVVPDARKAPAPRTAVPKPSLNAPVASGSKPKAVPAPENALRTPQPEIDFGGSPFVQAMHVVSMGEPKQSIGFSFISVAVAGDSPGATSCLDDRPRVSRSVKALKDGAEYKFNDYMPGAFGNSWVGTVNGHLIALNDVVVLKDGGMPARQPTVLIYKNFSADAGRGKTADFKGLGQVNSYAGTKGVLYRVFFDGAGPAKCIDLILPSQAPFNAQQGFVFQERQQKTFAAEFKPRVPA